MRRRFRLWRYSERRRCGVCQYTTRATVGPRTWTCRWCHRLQLSGGRGIWWAVTWDPGHVPDLADWWTP